MFTDISNVAEVAIYVDDLPRAITFYTSVLSLPISAQYPDACFLQTGPDSTIILFDRKALAERQSPIPHHGATGPTHIALAVPIYQMDAWRDRLKSLNITIEHEQKWPQGTLSIYFRDPDNNSIELIDGRHYGYIWDTIGA
ncbi:MAG TPA: VOC family protein [Anaerolineae bacterium]|nr:VOC family protein [Anaerolineae bacterium]